jgi:hypothetical protein
MRHLRGDLDPPLTQVVLVGNQRAPSGVWLVERLLASHLEQGS